MLRLEDKVVVLTGYEQPRHFRAGSSFANAALDLLFEVGLPTPKIIVHVDRGDAAFEEPRFQRGDATGGGQSEAQESFALRKIEVIDDIDEQEDRL